MTDYLEQLLEGQEEEEPGQELEWGRAALFPWTRQTQALDSSPDVQSAPELWEELARGNETARAGQVMSGRDREVYDGSRTLRPAPVSDMDTEQGVEFEEETDMVAGRMGQESGVVLDAGSGRSAARGIGLASALAAVSLPGTRLAFDLSVEMARRNRLDTQSLTGTLTRLHRAARQVNAQVAQRNVSGPERAGERTGAGRMSGPAQNGSVDVAALVDAAFARDARRYDGPLGLL